MTINPFINDGFYNTGLLDAQEQLFQNGMVRNVRFTSPLIIKIDGKSNRGIVFIK
jgi:hypothetical protein